MKYFARYNGKTKEFMPVDSEDFKKSLKMKEGDYVEIDTWKERNYNFHKKYFALLNCAINHLPEHPEFEKYRDIEYFRKYLQIIIGKCEIIVGLSGKENYIPLSISFKNMDEVEFTDLYNKTLDAILRYFLAFIPRNEFENDILNFF